MCTRLGSIPAAPKNYSPHTPFRRSDAIRPPKFNRNEQDVSIDLACVSPLFHTENDELNKIKFFISVDFCYSHIGLCVFSEIRLLLSFSDDHLSPFTQSLMKLN